MEKKKLSAWKRLINSFDTKNEGFSGRKLSGFFGMVLIAFLDVGYIKIGLEKDNFKAFPSVIGLHFLFVLLCLGLVHANHILSFKHGNKSNNNEDKQGSN